MTLPEITYKTTPITLGEQVLMDRIRDGVNTASSVLGLIVSRTNLSEQEALALELDEALQVMTKIAEALNQAVILEAMGKSL